MTWLVAVSAEVVGAGRVTGAVAVAEVGLAVGRWTEVGEEDRGPVDADGPGLITTCPASAGGASKADHHTELRNNPIVRMSRVIATQ